MTTKLADALREARVAQGISQEDMAFRLEMSSQSGFSRMERGVHSPLFSRLVQWAALLGYDIVLKPKEPKDST